MHCKRPTLRAAATLLFAGAALACGGGAKEEAATNVLLITLDTTRADALTPYGNAPEVTPNLARLAAESVLYERAQTVTPVTLPAHTSMLTGLYPPRHTVRDNGLWALPQSADTLAEALQGKGFQTAAFLAAVVLDASFGLDQGFETYVAPKPGARHGSSRYDERPARDVIDDALAWLAQRDPERRFFLWVHLFDAHGPHVPPPGFREGLFAENPYHGEVASMDAELGRLFEALRAEGLLETTTLLVVGDHGEAFGENGETSHGGFAYGSTMRVPMLLRDPSGARAGERSRATVSVVDVFPTLAEAAGLAPSASVDGQSLFRRTPPPGRGVYLESYVGFLSYGWSPLAGWVQGEAKYLHSSEPEFYALDRDPAEEHNVIAEESERARAFQREIAAMMERPALERDGETPIDDEVLAGIRGLGYAAAGGASAEIPHPLAPSDRPSPLAMRATYRTMLRALKLNNTGRPKEAEALFREVIREGDGNLFARNLLAITLMQQSRFAEAIPVLQEALALGPDRAESHSNLGVCLAQTGKLPEAEGAFRAALLIDPSLRDALVGIVIVLRTTGREQEAETYQARLEAMDE